LQVRPVGGDRGEVEHGLGLDVLFTPRREVPSVIPGLL